MERSGPDILGMLEILAEHDVEFIIVGALSAVLHGVPVMTLDVDIVHRRSEANVARLLLALEELEATYRGHPAALRPRADHLISPGHQLLTTRCGPLDLLGAIEEGLEYERLQEHRVILEVDSLELQVLTLRKYVELKEGSTREKDRARLPLLRRVLRGEDEG